MASLADKILNMTQTKVFVNERVENIVGRGKCL